MNAMSYETETMDTYMRHLKVRTANHSSKYVYSQIKPIAFKISFFFSLESANALVGSM